MKVQRGQRFPSASSARAPHLSGLQGARGGLRTPDLFRTKRISTTLQHSGSSPAERKQLASFIKGYFAERKKSVAFWTNIAIAAVWNFVTFDTVYNWTFIGDLVAAGIGTNEAMVWVARAWVWGGGAYLMFILAKTLFWDLPAAVFRKSKGYDSKEVVAHKHPVEGFGGLAPEIERAIAEMGGEVHREPLPAQIERAVLKVVNQRLLPQMATVIDSRGQDPIFKHMIPKDNVIKVNSSTTPEEVLGLIRKHPRQPFFPVVEEADPGALRGVVFPEHLTPEAITKALAEVEAYNQTDKGKKKPERVLSKLMVPVAALDVFSGSFDKVVEADQDLSSKGEVGRCVLSLDGRFDGIYLLPDTHPSIQIRRAVAREVGPLQAQLVDVLKHLKRQGPEDPPPSAAVTPPPPAPAPVGGKPGGKGGKPKADRPAPPPAADAANVTADTGDKPAGVEPPAKGESTPTPPAAPPAVEPAEGPSPESRPEPPPAV